MFVYIIRRLLSSIPVILLLTFVIFALMRAIPGGPFDFVGDKSLPKAVTANLERRHHFVGQVKAGEVSQLGIRHGV